MQNMKIGIDIDGTVTEIIAPLVGFLRERGFVVPSYEDTADYDLTKLWGCSKDELVRRVFEFYKSEEFRRLQPISGVREAFALLFPPHEGYFITSRPAFVGPRTMEFFDVHFGGRLKSFYHLGEFGGNGCAETKGAIAKRLNLDVFVEDALHQAEEIASYGIPVLLMTQPWNRGRTLREGIVRVDGWKEIVDFVENYKK